jgi:hypothetical protein
MWAHYRAGLRTVARGMYIQQFEQLYSLCLFIPEPLCPNSMCTNKVGRDCASLFIRDVNGAFNVMLH